LLFFKQARYVARPLDGKGASMSSSNTMPAAILDAPNAAFQIAPISG
jgi:hypothetical protein